jgi:hypothetical protein
MSGHPISEATRAKISAARMGQTPWNKGIKRAMTEHVCIQCGGVFDSYFPRAKYCSDDCYHAAQKEHGMPEVTRVAIRKANLGSQRSEEAREKTAAKLRGRTHPGYPMSEKTKTAMSLGKKAYWAIPGNREIMSLNEMGSLNHAFGKPSWNMGIPMSDVAKTKLSAIVKAWAAIPENRVKLSHPGQKGDMSPCWKGGLTPEKIREWAEKHQDKRRDLASVPLKLNLWFPGCERHHLQDPAYVVYVPRWMHQGKGCGHNHHTGKGMVEMDARALAYAGLTAEVLDDTLPFD